MNDLLRSRLVQEFPSDSTLDGLAEQSVVMFKNSGFKVLKGREQTPQGLIYKFYYAGGSFKPQGTIVVLSTPRRTLATAPDTNLVRYAPSAFDELQDLVPGMEGYEVKHKDLVALGLMK